MWRLEVHLGLPLSRDSYLYLFICLFICLLFIEIGSFIGTPSLLIRRGCLASEPQGFTNLSLPSTGIIATMPDSLYRGWGLNSGLGACMTTTLLINRTIITSPVSRPSSRSASCAWLHDLYSCSPANLGSTPLLSVCFLWRSVAFLHRCSLPFMGHFSFLFPYAIHARICAFDSYPPLIMRVFEHLTLTRQSEHIHRIYANYIFSSLPLLLTLTLSSFAL